MINPLATKLYRALLLLRRGNGTLDEVLNGVFTFKLTELDVAQVETALGAYEDAATVAALSVNDERACILSEVEGRETARRLANNNNQREGAMSSKMRVNINIYSVENGDYGINLGWCTGGVLRDEDFDKIHRAVKAYPESLPYGIPAIWDSESGIIIRADRPDPDCQNCDGTGGALEYGRCGACWSVGE